MKDKANWRPRERQNNWRPGTVTGYIMHKKAKPGAAEDKKSCKKANEKGHSIRRKK